MAWLKIRKAPLLKNQKREVPDGIWLKCNQCQETLYRKDFEMNQKVCMSCHYHYPLTPHERISALIDQNSFQEFDENLVTTDPLGFKDQKPYSKRASDAYKKTGNRDAIVCGQGKVNGMPLQLGVFDFRFMGGSMGSAVGEKIYRLICRATEKKDPLLIVSSSGGARMQEGILSLMQMAKTCSALGEFHRNGGCFISLMTNPTTGGVAASYAMLGDINIGEPGALIGFAGPRVIKQTIGEDLPKGFQTSEYLLEHGMLDLICSRYHLKSKISDLLKFLCYNDNF